MDEPAGADNKALVENNQPENQEEIQQEHQNVLNVREEAKNQDAHNNSAYDQAGRLGEKL